MTRRWFYEAPAVSAASLAIGEVMSWLVAIAGGIAWIAGWVLAHGFWSTFFAVVCPPWSFYLVAERVMTVWGWL